MLKQRTIVVLTSLIAGLTAISSLLLALDPGPVAPRSDMSLMSVETQTGPESRLFETEGYARPWQAIVIHDTGTLTGSDETIRRAHQRLGKSGLGYHFVINNRSGGDGRIHVGFRWRHQFDGDYLATAPDGQADEATAWFHGNAIGVVLVGDADREPYSDAQLRELAWLVQQLQAHMGIPRSRVYVEVGSTPGVPARHFPYAAFTQQLLSSPTSATATVD